MNNSQKTSVKGFNWVIDNIEPADTNQLINKFGISEVIARILAGRNVEADKVENFLNPTLKKIMPDPFHLLDMEKAAEIISNAIIENKKIVIFGDYDVDGATSSALLKRFFALLNVEASIYIPDRIGEGYGPSVEAFELLKSRGTQVIITVDCGTAAFEAIEYGVNNGLEIIVVDHHLSGDKLPAAHALVNPNRSDETSKYGYLAAVGVAFLVAVAVVNYLRKKSFFKDKTEPSLLTLLDIVAIGTICDVVPLEELNRAFVIQGLKVINQRKNVGIVAITKLLNIENEITTYHIGYVIGPRINAGGRVGESSLGARLLSTDNLDEATEIVNKLELYNSERKAIEFSVFEQALIKAREQSPDDALIMVSGEGWHPGVVGIVAGRLKEIMNKPAAVLSLNNNQGKASCRSVPGVDFGSAIVEAKEEGILLTGGGHKMAAGFTVLIENLPAIKSFLHTKFTKELSLLTNQNNRSFSSYVAVGGVNLEIAKQIEKIGPFGPSNPEPKFILKNVYIAKTNVFAASHINCYVKCADSKSLANTLKINAFRAIDTALGNLLLETKSPLNLVGYIRINRWRNQENPEFILEDAILL